MPYVKSISRKEFENVIMTFISQVRYASRVKNGISHEIQQCVYRSAIFQTSAAIEEYVQTILEDWIHMLHIKEKTLKDLPDELCIWAVGKRQKDIFGNYIVKGDEKKFISKILSINTLKNLFDNNTKVSSVIPISDHINDKKYPSKKNLEVLFNRFGIKDIFSQTQIKGKKDYKRILESFSDIRTEIAHQHPTPDLIPQDVCNKLSAIKDFVTKIDRVVFSKVVCQSGIECWKIDRLAS